MVGGRAAVGRDTGGCSNGRPARSQIGAVRWMKAVRRSTTHVAPCGIGLAPSSRSWAPHLCSRSSRSAATTTAGSPARPWRTTRCASRRARSASGRPCASPTPRSAPRRSSCSRRWAARCWSTTASSTPSGPSWRPGLIIFLAGWPISVYAARHGVDMDLLTRGAGLRLHRLDHHLAHLRELHLHLLRARGGHHGVRHRARLRHPAGLGLPALLAGRDSARGRMA